jgi:hypothetical protein
MFRSSLLLLFSALLVPAGPRKISLIDGAAEFEWLSPSTFRITRSWDKRNQTVAGPNIVLESAHLSVEIDPRTMDTRVSHSGKLLAELEGPKLGSGKIILDRKLAANERIYGTTGATDRPPFIFSSEGFGQLIRGAEKYLVDAGSRDAARLRVIAQGSDKIEYVFMYGPQPKQIFAERKLADPIPDVLPSRRLDLRALNCERLHSIISESLAGILQYENAGPEWEYFIGAYMRESHDRGLPTIRPLLFQFPQDPKAPEYTNVAMFGDELLIAPRCASPLTLPQGLWTDFDTDLEYKGRTTVDLSQPVTLFARNGSIVPLLRNGVVELHYFPRLGAEFFIFESTLNDYSQVHASPAGDFWRLEIESKVSRTYEWVLHHIGDQPKRIRVEAKAGGDHILNIPI